MIGRIFGNVVEIDGVRKRIINFDKGRITSVDSVTDGVSAVHGADNYNDNFLIFPGFIDIHTHCREDTSGKDIHKEDYLTVGRAALSGGVVCIADMPNNPIVPRDLQSYNQKRCLAESKCPIDVLIYAGISQAAEPFDGNLLDSRIKQCDRPYKVFMGPSTNHSGDLNFDDKIELLRTLGKYAGRSVSFHCENPTILDAMVKRSTHETRRPPDAEFTAIDTAIEIINSVGCRGKICHVSTQIGLESILMAKTAGVNVECEITPHHLYFDTEMLTDENRRWLQMNPPIRSRKDREFLLQAVKNGKFDYLATDHAPHTKNEKMRGISGVPTLDTYGPFVAWLLNQGVSAKVLFQMACQRPGEWIRQFWPERQIGRILPGYEASFTVLDLSKSAIDGRPLYTKCGWSPFDLRNLPGMVQTVWLKGERVVEGQYIKGF